MLAQVTLTVPVGKRLIAAGLSHTEEIRRALAGGKIWLKGGTTVSAVAEELGLPPMRISGRISPNGARCSRESGGGPHHYVWTGEEWISGDEHLAELVSTFGPGDVVVVGANAFDALGHAAFLTGSPLGGNTGRLLHGVAAEGAAVLVAAGLEKLVPGDLTVTARRAGRRKIDAGMGMGCGLILLPGRVFTELDAIHTLARVEATVVAKGGIDGAEGAATLLLEGAEAEVEAILRLIQVCRVKAGPSPASGSPESLIECVKPGPHCRTHTGCNFHYYSQREGGGG